MGKIDKEYRGNKLAMKNLGLRVVQIRCGEVLANKPMTQKEFANQVKLNIQTIYNLEHGKSYPSELTIRKICNYFNVNYEWLKYGTGDICKNSNNTNNNINMSQLNINSDNSKVLTIYNKDLTAFINQINIEGNDLINNSPVLRAMLLKFYGI